MLKLFRRNRPAAAAESIVASIPEGRRCYAIGDVHGCLDVLRDLVGQIRADAARPGCDESHVVFLGDLIDRGPDSMGVIDYLLDSDWSWTNLVVLEGNHEEAFRRSLSGDLGILRQWMGFGGRETCESYGLGGAAWAEGNPVRFLERLSRLVPDRHIAFLDGLYDSFEQGDYLFVHAGIRPGVPLADQHPSDLRWIRDEFLKSTQSFGKLVVHGHTISEEPELRSNRIGIDTGAYKTGRLTALALEGGSRRLLTAFDPSLAGGEGSR